MSTGVIWFEFFMINFPVKKVNHLKSFHALGGELSRCGNWLTGRPANLSADPLSPP